MLHKCDELEVKVLVIPETFQNLFGMEERMALELLREELEAFSDFHSHQSQKVHHLKEIRFITQDTHFLFLLQ